jgi:glutamate synthase (NADPH/NADH) large chain
MRLEVSQPVLDFKDIAKLRNIEHYTGGKFRSYELNICYPVAWGKEGVEARLASLCAEAVDAVRSGYNILIVSDRAWTMARWPFPRCWPRRPSTSTWSRRACAPAGLVVETGSAREVHHFALLAGYGAEAVHPYLAMETLADMARACRATCRRKGVKNFIKAIGKGLHKVMSKMGISTYMSYTARRSSKPSACRANWCRSTSRHAVERRRHRRVRGGRGSAAPARDAFGSDPVLANMLDAGGEYAFRIRGEEHMWTPDAIAKLQHSRADVARPVPDVQGIRQDHQRPEPPTRCAACSSSRSIRPAPFRWTKSSRPRRSSSVSPPAPCRWARSRPKPTPRWPWR